MMTRIQPSCLSLSTTWLTNLIQFIWINTENSVSRKKLNLWKRLCERATGNSCVKYQWRFEDFRLSQYFITEVFMKNLFIYLVLLPLFYCCCPESCLLCLCAADNGSILCEGKKWHAWNVNITHWKPFAKKVNHFLFIRKVYHQYIHQTKHTFSFQQICCFSFYLADRCHLSF